jgi:hypothetical protein
MNIDLSNGIAWIRGLVDRLIVDVYR